MSNKGLGMAKLGEPAVYRPEASYVVCLRCRASVGVEDHGSSFRLTYDINDWQQRALCCCLHLGDPIHCYWFSELRRAITDLGVRH